MAKTEVEVERCLYVSTVNLSQYLVAPLLSRPPGTKDDWRCETSIGPVVGTGGSSRRFRSTAIEHLKRRLEFVIVLSQEQRADLAKQRHRTVDVNFSLGKIVKELKPEPTNVNYWTTKQAQASRTTWSCFLALAPT